MMLRLLVLSALVALSAAQSTDSPNKRCRCEIGLRGEHSHEEATLFEFENVWDRDCTHSGEDLCREECETDRDVLEAFGGWSVVVPGENNTVGEIACRSLGQDVSGEGLETALYTALCDAEPREVGHGLHERLCCSDGLQVKC